HALAPDGSWIAIANKEELVVFDGTGRELARRKGKAERLVASGRKLAIIEGRKVFEGVLDPVPVWTEIVLPLQPPHGVFDFIYRGDRLDLYASTGDLYEWNGQRAYTLSHFDRIASPLFATGDATVLIAGADGKLHFVNDLTTGTLSPASVLSRFR